MEKEVSKTQPTLTKALKGKQWIPVFAPAFFESIQLGEVLAAEPASLVGRTLSASLADLTGDPGRYYFKLFFRIFNVQGNRAETKFFGHDCTMDFISRIVQLRTQRIDTNEVLQLKDGRVRVKTITITNRKVSGQLDKLIRKTAADMVREELSPLTIEEFVRKFSTGEVQGKVRDALNKLYPVRAFEIKKSRVL